MPDLITINDVQIEHLTYHDEPVVTFEMIARVHGISVRNVHRSFERHQDRFTEGKHVYRLDYAEARQLPRAVEVSPNGLRLFTEKGYLLLVKPMKDERSWQVQERMVDNYFAMRQALQDAAQALPPPAPSAPLLPLPEETATRLLATRLDAGNLLGIPLYINQQEAVKAVLASTGVDYRPLLLSAPAQDNIPEEAKMLEPTDLAAALGWGKQAGARMNKALEAQGWQCKTPAGTWDVTPLGAPHAADHAWTKGPKSGFNLRWNVAAVRRALAP